MTTAPLLPFAVACMLAVALDAAAQHEPWRGLGAAGHLVVPQTRAVPLHEGAPEIRVEAVHARVRLLEQTATTTLDVTIRNPGTSATEAVLLLPVPHGAVVSELQLQGEGDAKAQVLARDEARRAYEAIVAKVRDPALLEFAGHGLLRSSVFPVPASGVQRLRVTYEHVCAVEGTRIDYVLPRSESLEQRAVWTFDVDAQCKGRIAGLWSPSHDLAPERVSAHRMRGRAGETGGRDPGAFRVCVLRQANDADAGLAATLFACPDPARGGGWFLLLAAPPANLETGRAGRPREVTLVLDRSGSMRGGKLDQARAAALQVIEALADGEAFQVVDYATDVSAFASAAVPKDPGSLAAARRYLAALQPGGGTNVHDALVAALQPEPRPGTRPIVLFLTDGLPTIGRTGEVQIREAVERANVHGRRIFTFGVGHDVNVPLLDRVAEATRGTTALVQPGEDVAPAMAKVFRRLHGPVLADADLVAVDASGMPAPVLVADLHPRRLPDLYQQDQLVVLGRYREPASEGRTLRFNLGGEWLGEPRRFELSFDLSCASTRNAFVPRLWASRRIAFLIDQVRQAGAADPARGLAEPRFAELRDEIVRLSTEFGVLGEYTSFLATEGTDLGDPRALARRCAAELDDKAVRTRWGIGAVSQGCNLAAQKAQAKLNYRNEHFDAALHRVAIGDVQQICDRAFFRRGERWIDGHLVARGELHRPARIVRRGSDEHRALLEALVAEGRPGLLSLDGEILLHWRGENVLVQEAPR